MYVVNLWELKMVWPGYYGEVGRRNHFSRQLEKRRRRRTGRRRREDETERRTQESRRVKPAAVDDVTQPKPLTLWSEKASSQILLAHSERVTGPESKPRTSWFPDGSQRWWRGFTQQGESRSHFMCDLVVRWSAWMTMITGFMDLFYGLGRRNSVRWCLCTAHLEITCQSNYADSTADAAAVGGVFQCGHVGTAAHADQLLLFN